MRGRNSAGGVSFHFRPDATSGGRGEVEEDMETEKGGGLKGADGRVKGGCDVNSFQNELVIWKERDIMLPLLIINLVVIIIISAINIITMIIDIITMIIDIIIRRRRRRRGVVGS